MTPLVTGVRQFIPHAGKVKGGQFKDGVDIHAPGAEVRAPFDAKVNHARTDRTQCEGATLASQLTLSEETLTPKRHLTGFRLALAHLEPVPGLGAGALHHVTEGTPIGHVAGGLLHAAANQPGRLPELY